MANSFAQSTLVKEELAFQFGQYLGPAKYVDWSYTSEFKGEVNAGYTRWLRRPSLYDSVDVGVNGDYSLPGYTVGPDWQGTNEPTFPLTLAHRRQTKLQIGFEELIVRLSKGQFKERHIDGALQTLASQVQQDLANDLAAASGQSLGTPGSSIVGSTYQDNISNARILLNNRGVPVAKRRRILLNPSAATPLSKQQFTQYHSGSQVDNDLWEKGKFGNFADFEIDDFYVLPSISVAAYGDSLSYTFPSTQGTDQSGASYAWPLTQWYPTFQVAVTGLAVATPILAGTQVVFDGITWFRPMTHTDTGTLATFTVAQTVTPTGSAGNYGATLILREPLIASGAQRNVSAVPVSGTNAFHILGQSATIPTTPSFAFAEGSIIGASPVPPVPDGVKSMIIKSNGINIALWQDHFPGSNQNITMMLAIYGITAIPDHIVKLY